MDAEKQDWKKKALDFFKINFSKKNNLWRLLWFFVGCSICLIPSLACNLLIRNGSWFPSHIEYNPGIAFGNLENNPAAIYAIQSIICVIIACLILFTNKWYYTILLSLAFCGGFFNIIDRATQYLSPIPNTNWQPDYVLDYINTLWFFDTISNVPDICILTGIIGFAVLYITMLIIQLVKDKKQEDIKKTTACPN
ncbi:MAG: signal peptidase II [Mycoplasmataceae bacterium]|jgi:lipoprotein signal peptidase|nr:signal peptidase II [Mycoplasmataceae bacterium]